LPRFFDDRGVAVKAGATPMLALGAGAGAAVAGAGVVDVGAQVQGAVEGLIASFIIL